jgi:hypothetical protein
MDIEFKVGDKVSTVYGKGTIKFIDYDSTPYAVEHDSEIRYGHTCNNFCKNNRGYWYKEEELTLIEETTPIKDTRLERLDELIKAVNTLGEFGKQVELKITIELDGKKIEL